MRVDPDNEHRFISKLSEAFCGSVISSVKRIHALRTSAAKTAQVTLLQSDNTGQATGGEALRVKATTPLEGSCRGVLSHPHRHCHTPTSKHARGTSVIAINAAAGRHQDLSLRRRSVLAGEIGYLAQQGYGADSSLSTFLVWLFIAGGVVYAIGGLIAIITGWSMGMKAVTKDRQRKVGPPDHPRPPDGPNRQRKVTPRPPDGPIRGKRPIGFRLWGHFYPVKYGNEILLGVAKCLYIADWASRDRGNRWKEVAPTGVFLNANLKVDELIRRSHSLLEFFGHSRSDLEVVYDGTSRFPRQGSQPARSGCGGSVSCGLGFLTDL